MIGVRNCVSYFFIWAKKEERISQWALLVINKEVYQSVNYARLKEGA